MKQRKIITIPILLALLTMLLGCGGAEVREHFVKEDALDENKYEYIADVVVHKEGYHFLWAIPAVSASETAAKDMMRDKTKETYPNAAGVYEMKIIFRQGVGLGDWSPCIAIKGKVVRRRPQM